MKKEIIMILIIVLSTITLIYSQSENPINTNIEVNNSSTNEIINTNISRGIELISFIPNSFKKGDAQFNIRIQNNNNYTLTNVIALISGKGYSTYEIIPIDSLSQGERDYLIVTGNFKESGIITLIIKIDKDIFFQNVTISNPEDEDKEKKEIEKKEILENMTNELNNLKQKYYDIEKEYNEKKDNDYDVSNINLDQLKNYIRAIESKILTENPIEANANLKLASEEYKDQKRKLDSSKQKSTIMKLKDYAFIFSTIAGALITFFALSELLKRKSQGVVGGFQKITSTKKDIKPISKKKK